jgi:CYTH domain-containing protein
MASAAGFTLRVRLSENDHAWLTIKAPAEGIARHEFEYPIPADDGEQLLALAPHRLAKTRYGLDLPGGDWVVDVFEAENAPLVLAEVELQQEDQPIDPPGWCWREVTGRGDLSNAALAQHPLSAWQPAQKQTLMEGLEPS